MLLTLPEAAEKLRVHLKSIYRFARRDPTFPRLIKIGAHTRIDSDALATWIERGGTKRAA